MTRLNTTYLGMKLRSPIVVSACTLSEEVDNIVRMEDAGAGAVVMFSMFEEQIRKEEMRMEAIMQSTNNVFAEASDFFPDLDEYHVATAQYLETVRMAKERVKIPIIGSLNGITPKGWIDYAKQLEQAGADALEVNIFYIPADIRLSGVDVEQRYLDIIKLVKQTVKIPIAVKMNPYFSAMGHTALQMQEAGADGLVLFNRFYQPDYDILQLKVVHDLAYSEAAEIRLPLLWIAILSGQIKASLAATTGVQSATEVIKYLLAGADVTMTASALYKNGISYITTMEKSLLLWMDSMGFQSLDYFKGSMNQSNVSDPTAYERANYIRILEGAKK
ncbi:MAG: dihydroorotate dehydrogenase-like protein [Saprospiraceae bacterium]|nr:dihydroorotate dehydrogenase-like protein [Candidatus Opimibacter skivensis]MBL0008581.1 dihydroorotate dehydrogenase-like protein [Candidatus Opimibacter skivensis]